MMWFELYSGSSFIFFYSLSTLNIHKPYIMSIYVDVKDGDGYVELHSCKNLNIGRNCIVKSVHTVTLIFAT